MVTIANHRRRMEGDRFIGVHHVLFGLSLSRVGDAIQRILPDAGMNCFDGNPSKFPLYDVYRKSGDAAWARGEEVKRRWQPTRALLRSMITTQGTLSSMKF